jgi:hypothetical protein
MLQGFVLACSKEGANAVDQSCVVMYGHTEYLFVFFFQLICLIV